MKFKLRQIGFLETHLGAVRVRVLAIKITRSVYNVKSTEYYCENTNEEGYSTEFTFGWIAEGLLKKKIKKS